MLKRNFRWMVLLASLWLMPLYGGMAQAACMAGGDFTAQGQASYVRGDYAAAVEAYTCALQADSGNYSAYLGRAQAALLAGHYGIAVNDANMVTDYAPELADGAMMDYNLTLNMDSASVQTYMLRALFYWTMAQDQLVLQDVERIIQLDSQNAFAYLMRGSSNQYLGDRLTPPADFTQALLLAPNNAHIHALIGSTFIQTGDTINGMMHLDQALRLDSTNTRAYYFRGLVAMNENNYASALADFSRAIEFDPLYIDPYYDRGLTYGRQANYAQAISDFEQALRINPNFSLAYLQRGVMYELSGDAQTAARDFMQYIHLSQHQNMPGQALTPNAPVTLQLSEGLAYALPLAAQAGQTVTITASSSNNRADPLMVLLATDGTTALAGSDDAVVGNYTAAIRSLSLPDSGTYTLLVTHSDGGSEGIIDVSVTIQ